MKQGTGLLGLFGSFHKKLDPNIDPKIFKNLMMGTSKEVSQIWKTPVQEE